MVGAISKSDICNLALDYLLQTNEESVTNIDSPTTQTEVVCARWYDVARKSLLRRHPWNFATKRIVLTADVNKPAFGYDFAYNLPNDFIRVISLEEPDNNAPLLTAQYRVEGNQLLVGRLVGASQSSGAQSLNFIYIFNETNIVKFDDLFVDTLAIELASKIAYKFTASNTDVQRINSLLDDKLQVARTVDGQERPPTRIERSRVRQRRRILGSNQRSGIFFE